MKSNRLPRQVLYPKDSLHHLNMIVAHSISTA